ncbi:MAG: hypothetical protein DRP97_05525 [Candidatus Latescibacterota bacterium]|nr:MAG: hypothetical protein DRP97_05525 [Candidatus Latescibacterota bacterium]
MLRTSFAIVALALIVFSSASCIRGKDRPQMQDLGGLHDQGPRDVGDGGALCDGEAGRCGDLGARDGLGPDQGPPPSDFPCAGDPWVKTKKADLRCASRYVLTVESGLWENGQVAIAVDSKGKVGIAYGNENTPSEGQLHLVSFPVGSRQVPNPTVVAGTQHERLGVRVAMVPRSGGGFHLVHVDALIQGSELNYAGWTGSGQPVSELVSTEVGLGGSVDLVEAHDGRVFVVYYADHARGVYARVRPQGGSAPWSKPEDLGDDFISTVSGVGHLAVVRQPGGGLAYALHLGSGLRSAPCFRRYDALNGWSSKMTIDNKTYAGIAGQSIDLAITQTKHHATYFFVPEGSTTADLRLATWASSNDKPEITVLRQTIPTDAILPEYEAALAVDSWGLLHLAVILPSPKTSPGTSVGVLEYRRQVLIAGQKKWFTDIVDDDVLSTSFSSHVALWVEPGGRPHIAYFNGRTGKMMYATRDDRSGS